MDSCGWCCHSSRLNPPGSQCWLAILATAAIVFGALAAAGQNDFKRLVAYSSINHMGFVVLGIAAAAWAGGQSDPDTAAKARSIAVNGSVLQMFNHGLIGCRDVLPGRRAL